MYEQQNLKVLKETNYNLYKLVKSQNIKVNFEKNGATVKIGKYSLFSKYNPEKEANLLFQKWLKQNNIAETGKHILIFGISNPFVIKKFVIENFYITIFIPDIELFKILIKFYDYTEIIKKANIITGLDNIPQKFDIIYIIKIEERMFYDKFSLFQKKLSEPKKSNIKILLVKPFYGGSLPVANYCEFNLKKFNVTLKTIESNKGFETFNLISNTLNKKEFISDMRIELTNFISKMIFYAIEEFKPDIVFGVAQSPINDKVLRNIRQKGITSIFWFVEDFRLFTYWKYFAQFYDYYFVIQKDDFFEELKKVEAKNYYYLPLACEPSIHKPLNLTEEEKERFGSTLSFVGAGYYNRRKFFQKLINYDFKIWGSDWDNEPVLQNFVQENGRRISTEESVKIFNASLINLNLHSSTFYEGIVPNGDFVNPRTFEIAACNSFQLVDKRKYLFEHFNKNEILYFSSEKELKDLITNIMKNCEKYNEIKENSYKKVIQEHTYEKRMLEIGRILGIEFKKTFSDFLDEKDFYLSKFNNLEEIADYIEKKDRITKTDAIFMLMKSLKDTYLK